MSRPYHTTADMLRADADAEQRRIVALLRRIEQEQDRICADPRSLDGEQYEARELGRAVALVIRHLETKEAPDGL